MRQIGTQDTAVLSSFEIELLESLGNGKSVDEIAAHKFISAHTISAHMNAIKRKLCAKNTTHAVALAIKMGVVDLLEIEC